MMALFELAQPPLQLLNTWLILLAHVFYNTTVVMRVVGGAWEAAGPAPGTGRAGAGGFALARSSRGDTAAAAPVHPGGGAAGVPVRFHQFWGGAAAGRAALRHPRSGDLHPGAADAQPAAGRAALGGAAGLHPAGYRCCTPASTAAGRSRSRRACRGRAAQAAHAGERLVAGLVVALSAADPRPLARWRCARSRAWRPSAGSAERCRPG